jgi:predicted lactoylglutathione lyase
MKKFNDPRLVTPNFTAHTLVNGAPEVMIAMLAAMQDQIDELKTTVERQGAIIRGHEQTVSGFRVYK